MVLPADSTVVAMRSRVRRLTGSPSPSSLTDDEIDQKLNTFISQDFPYAIKMDQMRSVYTFYTAPYTPSYPINVNYIQGVRDPLYIDGIPGYFSKDRGQFYATWPRFPAKFQPISGDGVTTVFAFTIPGPILQNNITLGGVSTTGAPIRVQDDGQGTLQVVVPNPQVSVPSQYTNVPGMKNLNTANPGDLVRTAVGTVNYVTGAFAIDFSLAGVIPTAGEQMSLFVSQYQTGRPYSVLFWNNQLEVRPIPKLVHKIELEVYLTPVQFILDTDVPIINQWWQYIALGAAIKILEDRQDMEGVDNLMGIFLRQEALVLERQAVEEIGQRNATIFSSSTPSLGWNNGYNSGWWY